MEYDDKIQFKVYLSNGVVERFRRFIASKHQKYRRGLLSLEVEQALMHHIASYNTQQQSTQKSILSQQPRNQKQPKVLALKEDIFKYLIDSEQYIDTPGYITDRQLFDAIGMLKGTDQRTIRKWMIILQQYGIIRWSGVHQIEFI